MVPTPQAASSNMSVIGILLVLFIGLVLVVGIVCVVLLLTQKPSNNAYTANDGDITKSYFDGNTLQYIGWNLLTSFITTITLGIAYPWAMCMMERWKAKHTVINGRRLKFTGSGAGLFGNYILWYLLTVITLGIYSIWFGLGVEKWKVKHLSFADGDNPVPSRFTGGAGGWFGYHILSFLLPLITFGIGFPWGQKLLISWRLGHSEIGGARLTFDGTGLGLWGKYLLGGLLTVITLGIYGLFFPVSLIKWEVSHTFALYRTEKYRKLSRLHEEAANKDFAKFKLAANNAELEILKDGMAGSDSSSVYAMYNKSKEGGEGSLELLRLAADGGYHLAAFDYAFNGGDTLTYLEISAKGGNPTAPWLLANEYKNLAVSADFETPAGLEYLKKSAYWYKIAIEQEHPDAVASINEYNFIVEKIALYSARLDLPSRQGSNAGIIVAVIAAAAVIVIGILAVLAGFLNVRLIDNKRPTAEIAYYIEDYTGYAFNSAQASLLDKGITVKKVEVYSDIHPINQVIDQDFKGAGYTDTVTLYVAKQFDFDTLDNTWESVYLDEDGLYVSREISFYEDGTVFISTDTMKKVIDEDYRAWVGSGESYYSRGTYSINGNKITMDLITEGFDEDGDRYEEEETKVFVIDTMYFYEDERGNTYGKMALNEEYYDGEYTVYFPDMAYNYDEMLEIIEGKDILPSAKDR